MSGMQAAQAQKNRYSITETPGAPKGV